MTRLLVVGHGPTVRVRDGVFGDASPLARPVERLEQRVERWVCGPEPACLETAAGLAGQSPAELAGLARCDFGVWQGRSLAEVAADDPAGVAAWTSEPDARPHGGETLAELVARVGTAMDGFDWPAGGSAAVVTPLVARAATVWALAAPASVIFRIDVGPLGAAELSGGPGRWRLRELRRTIRPGGGRYRPGR